MIKIMLIDDSKALLSLVEEIIHSDVNHETEINAYSSAMTAQQEFLSTTPDIVITDIEMPEVNGLQLIEYIRSISKVPVLAMSGSNVNQNSTETILYCAESVGANYTIFKDELIEKLPMMTNDIITNHCI